MRVFEYILLAVIALGLTYLVASSIARAVTQSIDNSAVLIANASGTR